MWLQTLDTRLAIDEPVSHEVIGELWQNDANQYFIFEFEDGKREPMLANLGQQHQSFTPMKFL